MRNYDTTDAVRYLEDVHGLKRSGRTLQNYRSKGGGPAYHRVNPACVMYSEKALDEWAREILGNPVRNTAQETGLPDMAGARPCSQAGASGMNPKTSTEFQIDLALVMHAIAKQLDAGKSMDWVHSPWAEEDGRPSSYHHAFTGNCRSMINVTHGALTGTKYGEVLFDRWPDAKAAEPDSYVLEDTYRALVLRALANGRAISAFPEKRPPDSAPTTRVLKTPRGTNKRAKSAQKAAA